MEKSMKEHILTLIQRPNFFKSIFQLHNFNLDELNDQLIILHNNNEINIISAIIKSNENVEIIEQIVGIFKILLPKIKAEVKDIIECIEFLTKSLHADPESFNAKLFIEDKIFSFKDAIINFCERDQARSKDLLAIAQKKAGAEGLYFFFALVSGAKSDPTYFTKEAKKLLELPYESGLSGVIFALGEMNINPSDTLTVIQAIICAAKKNPFEPVLRRSIEALCELCIPKHENELLIFLKNHENIHYDSFSRIALLNYFKIIEEATETSITEKLWEIAVSSIQRNDNEGSVRSNFIFKIQELLEKGNYNYVTDYIEKLILSGCESHVYSKVFECFYWKTPQKEIVQYLSCLVTRWLLSKNRILEMACETLIQSFLHKNILLKADEKQLRKNNSCSFLSRKACGWFFYYPEIMVHFILSLVDSAPSEELSEIKELLFNPILISYPKKLQAYFKNNIKNYSVKVKKFIEDFLRKYKAYYEKPLSECCFENLVPGKNYIEELVPSAFERFLSNQYFNDVYKIEDEKSWKNSTIARLGVKQEIIAYGAAAIVYQIDPKGKKK
ncbi:hypothetical protein [Commensalibacter sp. Nvir]|uniref:hypothetical protein n=1 Tax=Commensalibacter sp. Nvir TaxID=3069817 RepID=UPI0030C84A00